MSLLKTKVLFDVARSLSTSAVRAAHWNKDWQPAKYPVSEEERLAAAKKYGLLPIEYKPVPDDGEGAGDYPDLKPFSVESRDPFYPWDYPEYRRNYGEVLHMDAMIYTEDRYNINARHRHPLWKKIALFLGVMGSCWILMKVSEGACFFPVAELHRPKPGVKHYTYE